MNKVTVVRIIVRAYFVGALVMSFMHIVEASHLLGQSGWKSYAWPFMIDGIAVIGMVMRSESFSTRCRKIGFRTQLVAGLLSLVANVFAGQTLGDRIQGFAIVVLFVFSEWLSDQIESHEQEIIAEATQIVTAVEQQLAACTHPTKCMSVEQCSKKVATAAKAAKTRAATKRTKRVQEKVLADLVNAK